MSREKGKRGEALFAQIMQNKGYKVEDVSANPEYYYKGDLLITSLASGLTKTFEVKFDYVINNTGNLYLELWNKNSQNCQGWYKFCSADYLAYGDAKTGTFYIIELLELHKRVSKLPQRLRSCGEDSQGLVVSLEDIQDLIIEEVTL